MIQWSKFQLPAYNIAEVVNQRLRDHSCLVITAPPGAGKSTLLKLISKITAPTAGKILMNGRVASMLEVGTGFHPELTGRENIYMNGAILGMTKNEIAKVIDYVIMMAANAGLYEDYNYVELQKGRNGTTKNVS